MIISSTLKLSKRRPTEFGSPCSSPMEPGWKLVLWLLITMWYHLPKQVLSASRTRPGVLLLRQHSFSIICKMEENSQTRFFLMRSPLYPYSLSFTRPASSPECSEENTRIPFNGIPLDKKTWLNSPGPFWLHFSISFQPYPPDTPDTAIDEICPVLPFLSLHGLSFLPHPPAQILPFRRSQFTHHIKTASHIYKKPLTPCWEILYEFVEWTDEQGKKHNFFFFF